MEMDLPIAEVREALLSSTHLSVRSSTVIGTEEKRQHICFSFRPPSTVEEQPPHRLPLLSLSLDRSAAKDLATMAATANASPRLPTGAGVVVRSRRPASAAAAAPSWRRPSRRLRTILCRSSTVPAGAGAGGGGGGRMEDYNTAMKRMMRNPYEYHHDLGMNYAVISDSLIVGSQPQKPEDINHLKDEENVAYILCLQQDKDIEYWGIDFQAVVSRCKELGVEHIRRPAVDFDPDSLRKQLPKAVSALEWAISQGKGRVYIHCTAGLGRAPAVAICYMFWFENMDLNTAYDKLTSIRPCGPSKKAIRAATYDLAKSDPNKEAFENLPEHAFGGVSDLERKLIQDRVRALHKS